jgi:hypothetical protein
MVQAPIPKMPSSDGAPFYYASFAGVWVYQLVDFAAASALLKAQAPGFAPYDFGGGKALANLNVMMYAGHSGQNDPQAYIDILKPINPTGTVYPASLGVEGSNECEFNIVCFPTARLNQVQMGMSVMDFVAGKDHTKLLGNFRVGVPCDDRIAVYWGTQNFGENKIMTHPFLYNVPSPNNSDFTTGLPITSWKVIVPGAVAEAFNFSFANFTCSPHMLSLSVDVSSLSAQLGNASEIIDYSLFTQNNKTRPVGSRRNVFGTFKAYDLGTKGAGYAVVSIGDSAHPLVSTMQKLLVGAPIVAVQTFQSQPVIAESSLYYVDL